MTVDTLLEQIKSNDAGARTRAWQSAGEVGAPAIKPLVGMWTGDGELEVRRAAARALWQIVRHAARPGADAERKPVITELLEALDSQQDLQAQRDLMWMLSEIAGDEAVEPMAARLKSADLREDARQVLMRLPGGTPVSVLQKALETASAEFRPALADALRARGVKVADVPSLRLRPTKQTTIKPVAPA